ncbi:MAG TPA: peptide deformylase [Gammaproteobacteria bacterium]|nr:peptide deformylase [Gammaproteobacteria bacterium]|tara:strand:- start:1381 stop:1923 length:543 start_codon:yes stop_codon:yes gene_type:complete
MALLDILVYPDPRLRNKALPVQEVDSAIGGLVDDMAQTMYSAPGIGLAATQVNLNKRIVVIDTSEHQDQLQVFINPVLTGMGEQIETEEGCLSVPGVIVPVKRHSEVQVSALGKDGKPFELHATGLLAICIQHEVDHLDGKVFVDYLSQLKRDRIRKQLLREGRNSGKAPDQRKESVPAI